MKQPPPSDAQVVRRAYLDRPRLRRKKGGTVLSRHIATLEQHEAALAAPALFRLSGCLSCKVGVLHGHDRRERVFAGEVGGPGRTEILVFHCSRRDECGATWRVLPHVLARHLWRRWTLVGLVLEDGRHRVPLRTRQRWRQRLAGAAAVLVALLGQAATPNDNELARRVGADATGGEVITAAGGPARLADLAELLDHLEPGVRLM